MRTPFEELICKDEAAQFFLRACVDERTPFFSFLYDWQTLFGGFLALVAAFGSGFLLWIQISRQRKKDKIEASQKVKAALIPVPHALTEIGTYLQECFEAWERELPDERPQPPADALKIIMEAAPYVDDESFVSFQQLIITSQTFESRVASPGRVRAGNILDVMIADIATLSYLTTRLYGYGRMDNEKPLFHMSNPNAVISKKFLHEI